MREPGSRGARRFLRPAMFPVAVLLAVAAPAAADVTIEISDAARQASDAARANVRPEEHISSAGELQDLINTGLRKRAQAGDQAAADLLNSNQTIRILSFGEEEAERLGLRPPPPGAAIVGVPGYGETKGDFGADGRPRPNGKAYIAISPDLVRAHGWHGAFGLGNGESMWKALLHELFHATNAARRHGVAGDRPEDYDNWVRDFDQAVTEEDRGGAHRRERQRQREERRLQQRADDPQGTSDGHGSSSSPGDR